MIEYSIRRTIQIIINYSLLYLLPFALVLICIILFFKNYKKFDRWMKVTGSILIFLMFINWVFSLIEWINYRLNPNSYGYECCDWIILLYFAFVIGISVFLFLFTFFIHKFIKRNIKIARILSVIFSLISFYIFIVFYIIDKKEIKCPDIYFCTFNFIIYILPILLIFYSFFLIYLSFRKKIHY
ncbi:MAG: hypothetical protein QW117_00910 [Candidatus Pacearchaeota archaeon]